MARRALLTSRSGSARSTTRTSLKFFLPGIL